MYIYNTVYPYLLLKACARTPFSIGVFDGIILLLNVLLNESSTSSKVYCTVYSKHFCIKYELRNFGIRIQYITVYSDCGSF